MVSTVRRDLQAARAAAWEQISAAGTWLSGAQRVAIAEEVRHARSCELCQRRKAAVSPYSEIGEHDASVGDRLSPTLIDVVHRVVTDPGRLSKTWYDATMAAGLGEAEYVEAIGVIARTTSLDAFRHALGEAHEPIPGAGSAEPSRRRPSDAGPDDAWVPLRPGPSNIARALSLVPDEVAAVRGLANMQYVPDDRVMDMSFRRAITRPQMELIAARVSALSECFY
jgi:hypothetical protein